MILPGRPKGEFRGAQQEGTRMIPLGRPKAESRSAQHEGSPVSAPGRSRAPDPGHAVRGALQ